MRVVVQHMCTHCFDNARLAPPFSLAVPDFRVDVGELKPAKKLPNGWLRADAHLTRTGVFTYVNPDGTKRREYRSPEEVFNAESLDSFQMVPITDEHPAERYLTAANTAGLQKGNVGEAVTKNGKFVKASILVTDEALVDAVLSKKKAQVSCGYLCDVEPAPKGAVTADGEAYDYVQKNIRGNHVALLQTGRAGPDARVHLDAADAWMLPEETSPSGGSTPPRNVRNDEARTVKRTINGVTYDIPDQAAEAMAHEEKLRSDAAAKDAAALKDLTERVSKMEGSLDTTKAELAKEKARADAATSPAETTKLVRARVALMTQASEVLGKDEAVKLDAAEDKAVRLAVAKRLSPALNFDGKDDVYVQSSIDTALAHRKAAGASAFATVVHAALPIPTTDSAAFSADERRTKMIEESRLIHSKAREAHTTQ